MQGQKVDNFDGCFNARYLCVTLFRIAAIYLKCKRNLQRVDDCVFPS